MKVAPLENFHTIFDSAWYVEANPQVSDSGLDPLQHYLERGDELGLLPHPLFDPLYYGAQHPGLEESRGARLAHYLEHRGLDGSNPHPLFRSGFYLKQCPTLRSNGENPLVHYLTTGEMKGYRPNPLFDPIYYLAENPDLVAIATPLLVHYSCYGRTESRRPTPLFASGWYRERYREVAESGRDPLSHYFEYGDAAGFQPHPIFDPDHYSRQHPELERSQGERLGHYLTSEEGNLSDPHPLFHSRFYLSQGPELSRSGETLLSHYLNHGEAQGLKPNPLFDPRYYLKKNPDLRTQKTTLLEHYIRFGGRESRDPSPLFDTGWVLSRQPKLATGGENPLASYFLEGSAAGDDPHPLLDLAWYGEEYPEAASSGLEPLSHYVSSGAAKDFDPHPLFNSAWYREFYGDYLLEDEAPFLHYLERGEELGCRPNPFFDPDFYRRRYGLHQRPGASILAHYARLGSKKRRRPGPLFDFCVQFFRQRRPELLRRSQNPLAGYFTSRFERMSCAANELPISLPRADTPRISIVIPVHGRLVYTLACLRSISLAENRVAFEVIVADDGSPDDENRALSKIENLRLIRNEAQLGFLRSCNRAASEAQGEELVFLNNDTLVTDGWLDHLLETRSAFPRAGLVGSKLVFPNGRLQEAGSIVWKDGSAINYGYDDDPDEPAYAFARKVDYVSAASALIRRRLFEELGRFDEAYAPAFYEDTDLAFRVREAGWDVVYQPASTVIHFGGATHGRDTSRGLKRQQEVNRETFARRWSPRLEEHLPPDSDREAAALRLCGKRALVVDATMLTPDQDSGSLRMFNLIQVLRRLDFTVTFVPSDLSNPQRYVRRLQRSGVHVVCPPHKTSIEDFLEESGSSFDLCILSRPPVAEKWLKTVRLLCPRAAILYDTVDLHFLRRERELRVRGSSALSATTWEDERQAACRADSVITVSEFDRQRLLAEAPDLTVDVVSNIHGIHPPSRPFEEREGILFIGGFRHEPNVDAICWFVSDVLPLIRTTLPEANLRVVGTETPEIVRELASEHVMVEGFVPDLTDLLEGSRLSVAPLRYGSGVKGKVNQSMSFGLPCVATSIAAEGIDAKDGLEILVADGAEDFAAAVVAVYRDSRLWRTLSENSTHNIERNFSVQVAQEKLSGILHRYGLISPLATQS